jgi:hypothetical protein
MVDLFYYRTVNLNEEEKKEVDDVEFKEIQNLEE